MEHVEEGAARNVGRRLLFRVRVDLGGGQSGLVSVHSDSNPALLARSFCSRHNLPSEAAALLEREIRAEWQSLSQLSSPSISPQASATLNSPCQSPLSYKSRHSITPTQTPKVAANSRDVETEESRRAYFALLQERYGRQQVESKGEDVLDIGKTRRHPQEKKEKKKKLTAQEAEKVGERMHKVSTEWREKLELKHREAERARIEQEMKECTFRPQISKAAKEDPGGRTRGVGLEMRVRQYQEAKMVREYLQKEREKLLVEKECSFHPTISARSKEIASDVRQRDSNLHQELFLEAEKRRAMRILQALTPQYPFQPDVSATTAVKESPQEFLERIAKPKTADPMALDAYQRFDPTTGQLMFHPNVGRPPSEPHRPQSVPVTDYLFYSRHEFEDIKRKLRQEQEQLRRDMLKKNTSASESSRKIAVNIKTSRFCMLWKALNEDKVKFDETEELQLRCLVDLLPEVLVRSIGPDAILEVAHSCSQDEFLKFMMKSSRGIPCTTDLLST